MVRAEGSIVGDLDRALTRSLQMQDEIQRVIVKPYVDQLVGRLMGELFYLLGIKQADLDAWIGDNPPDAA